MVKTMQKGFAVLGVCAMLLPSLALADDMEARIAALEARIDALEAQLDTIADENEPSIPEATAFSMGEALEFEPGKALTIREYDTGSKFKYSPMGGFSSLTLSAKSGYRLLCLYVTVTNDSQSDLYTAQLLDTTLFYGSSYTNQAQDSFFYQNARGVFTGGLKSIGPRTSVDGCFLFAVPDDVDTSRERIAVQVTCGDELYECVLRPGGALLEPGTAETF